MAKAKRRSVSRNLTPRAEDPRSLPRRRLPRDLLFIPAPPRQLIRPALVPARRVLTRPSRVLTRPSRVSSTRPKPIVKGFRPLHPYGPNKNKPLRLGSLAMPTESTPCKKRSDRREVLFALHRAGYSGSAKKRYFRRTIESQFSC